MTIVRELWVTIKDKTSQSTLSCCGHTCDSHRNDKASRFNANKRFQQSPVRSSRGLSAVC